MVGTSAKSIRKAISGAKVEIYVETLKRTPKYCLTVHKSKRPKAYTASDIEVLFLMNK